MKILIAPFGVILALFLAFSTSCNNKEMDKLKAENDSLKNVLNDSSKNVVKDTPKNVVNEITNQAGEPSICISPTKMNIFYVGVDNPLSITTSGIAAEKLNVSMSGGMIVSNGKGKYIVRVKRQGKASITVTYKDANGNVKPLGSMNFKCLLVPNPYAVVGSYKGGSIQKSVLMSQTSVYAKLDNFVFDLKFPITEFNVSTTINGFIEEVSTRGSKISAEQKKIISSLKRGDKIYFEQVTCRAPDGSTRDLGTISFRIR